MPTSNLISSQKEIIPPEEYKKAVHNIHLVDMYFRWSEWFIKREFLGEKNHIDIHIDNDITEQDVHHSIFVQHYFLTVISEDKKEIAVEIKCSIVTSCKSEAEISKEFWKSYEQITLPVITVPYFREYVYSLTGKMGIPPIIVPHWVR